MSVSAINSTGLSFSSCPFV